MEVRVYSFKIIPKFLRLGHAFSCLSWYKLLALSRMFFPIYVYLLNS